MDLNRIPQDRLLTRAEVARIFQVSPGTITRWAEAGKLPSVKTLGGHHRYEAKAVIDLARSLIPIEEAGMEKLSIDVPAMYADHHVIEVRNILLALPGVDNVYASSAFHAVEINFSPDKISPEAIEAALGEAGYLNELVMPTETGVAVTQESERDKDIYFRHSNAFEQVKQVVSFAQNVSYAGRPLWHCPGIGVVSRKDLEEETNG